MPANDARASRLLQAFRQLGHDAEMVSFEPVPRSSKLLAAARSLSYPRMEWWQNYQIDAVVQQARRRNFQRNASGAAATRVVMWGSWFQPLLFSTSGHRIPYVYYVDQSRGLTAEPGEQKALLPRRRSGHREQLTGYESAKRVFGMSLWTVQQTLAVHPTLSNRQVCWAGWGPCAFDESSMPVPVRSEESPIVLHVGNDFYRKGADWFAEVARRVRRVRPDVRFLLVGQDQSNSGIRLGDDVEYLGPIQNPADLLDLFRKATVFLLPNRFERAGHVLVEAMSVGLPIVASLQGGPAEIVQDGKAGVGVSIGDVAGYSSAVLEILSQHDRRQLMAECGKIRARDTYSWTAVAGRILAAFEGNSVDDSA